MNECEKDGAGDVVERGARYAVTVRVDGQELTLKRFLHDMIGGSITGLLSELRGVDAADSVVIEVRQV